MVHTQLTTDDRQLTTVPHHLSSGTLVMNTSGAVVSNRRYMPFGEERTAVGTWLTESQGGFTDLGYTGQRNYA